MNGTEIAILGIDTTDPRTGRETVDVTVTDIVESGAMKGSMTAIATTDMNGVIGATTVITQITRPTATIGATNRRDTIDPTATARTMMADHPTESMILMTVVAERALELPIAMMLQLQQKASETVVMLPTGGMKEKMMATHIR